MDGDWVPVVGDADATYKISAKKFKFQQVMFSCVKLLYGQTLVRNIKQNQAMILLMEINVIIQSDQNVFQFVDEEREMIE